jgi:peptidyl-prolyl cis-trans isomerase A (cyclophilin A)/peptidyl-prolyl cis-trans isomerase B (cyclophilin B)
MDELEPLVPLPPRFRVTDQVEVKTSLGTFVVGLYGADAPRTVANCLAYVDKGFYTDKIFHRVIAGFMIQGGGFDASYAKASTDPPVQLEIIPGLKHEEGILSMARTSDPHSASSQFFVCVAPAIQLNGTYAAFGKVEHGYEVVEAISRVATHSVTTERGEMADVPVEPVVIEAMTRLEE